MPSQSYSIGLVNVNETVIVECAYVSEFLCVNASVLVVERYVNCSILSRVSQNRDPFMCTKFLNNGLTQTSIECYSLNRGLATVLDFYEVV